MGGGLTPACEVVDPTPDRYEDQDLVDFRVTYVREGIEAELTELFGELPAVRVVLNRVLPHAVDSNEHQNRRAGRYVVRQVPRESGLDEVPSPDGDYRVIRPRPSGSSSGTT